MEAKLFESNGLVRLGLSVSDHINAMLAYWDKNLICRFANKTYMHWLGKSKEEMVNKITMKELWGSIYEKNLPFIKGVLAGKKQVFEREIPLADGTIRYALATYFPDIVKNEVVGFYVHFADISYVKNLELEISMAKKEMLRNIIETEEKERGAIAAILRDNVSPTLAFCKMMLEDKIKPDTDNEFSKDLSLHIEKCVKTLRTISSYLMPSALEVLGLLPALENCLEEYKNNSSSEITIEYQNENIEKIDSRYKLSIFRIVQEFLFMLGYNKKAIIYLNFLESDVSILLIEKIDHNEKNEILKSINGIETRVEYYGGSLNFSQNENERVFKIELPIK